MEVQVLSPAQGSFEAYRLKSYATKNQRLHSIEDLVDMELSDSLAIIKAEGDTLFSLHLRGCHAAIRMDGVEHPLTQRRAALGAVR